MYWDGKTNSKAVATMEAERTRVEAEIAAMPAWRRDAVLRAREKQRTEVVAERARIEALPAWSVSPLFAQMTSCTNLSINSFVILMTTS